MKGLLLVAALASSGTADMQAVLDGFRGSQDIPGVSAVVVQNGELVFAGASGVADLESARPMTADTVLYMGSLSKVLTAVLTLQLIEAGELELDAAVGGIAAQPSGETAAVSIRHLLTHSSGLNREGDFNYWFTADFPDSEALSYYLATTSLRSPPGSTLHYSNIGYAKLGQVIETASDRDFASELRTRVLEPLGMHDSGVSQPAEGLANGYTPPGRIIPSAERPFAGVGRRVGTRHVRMYHDAQAMSPAFGAYASVRDLGKLTQFLLGNGGDIVLSRSMRGQMLEEQPSGRGLGLGLRHYEGQQLATHGGWFAAHRSYLLLDAANGIAVVVMANSDSASPRKIAEGLYEAALPPEQSALRLRLEKAPANAR